jgi:uncharacterized protein (TIGR02117 family)
VQTIKGILVALTALALAACASIPEPSAPGASVDAGRPVVVYVIKRSWHTDIGFEVSDLHPPLADLHTQLRGARYLLFGFGDRHYLIDHGGSTNGLLGAVWPGSGVILVTGLDASPEASFGAAGVIRLTLSATQARRLEAFVWGTLATGVDAASVLGAGPYDGSYYYAATVRYSGTHTCNTWTAEGLRAAGLPIHSFAVVFSGQVWRQVRKFERQQNARRPPLSLNSVGP